jgi:hypothetical protein
MVNQLFDSYIVRVLAFDVAISRARHELGPADAGRPLAKSELKDNPQ